MTQNNFMFYENFLDALDMLSDEQKYKACYEFCKFGITGELPDDAMMKMFCIGVSASVHKYQGRGGARDGAGRPYKNQNDNNNQNNQKIQNNQNNQNNQKIQNAQTETKTININFKEKDNLKVIQKEKFIKPSLQDVIAYCQERNNSVDAEKWFDYYQSNGWKVGKNPMKDWRAAVRTWEKGSEVPASRKTSNDDDFYKKLDAMFGE